MKSHEKSPPAEAGGPFDRSIRLKLALALLAGFLLAALLSALTARFLLLLAGFLLGILLAALLAALTTLAALLAAWILIRTRHWKRLLIAG